MVTGAYVSLLNAILQPFIVETLGYTVLVLGVLVAIGSRPAGLASSVIQPFAGLLADLLGRKLMIVLGSAVGIGSMASFFLAASSHSLLFLSFGYFLFGLSLLGNPATQATIAESTSMEPHRLNVAFSVVFFFTALPGAFVPFAAGYLTSTVGYLVIFAGSAALESANLVILITQLTETRVGKEDPPRVDRLQGFSLRRTLWVSRTQLRLFTPFIMDAFSFGLSGSIIYGIWTKALKLSQGDIGLIVGTLSVSIVASQYAATRLLLRAGARKTLAFSEALTVVTLAGWLLVPTLPALVLISVIFGVSVATWVPALSSLVMSSAPMEARGSIGGRLAFYRGIASASAPFLGALAFDSFGYSTLVSLSLVGETITVIAILRFIPK